MKYKSSAPGRVCILGEHQDYLELSVVPVAINLRTYIKYDNVDGSSDIIHVNALDLKKEFTLDIKSEKISKDPDSIYFQAGLRVFANHGYLSALKGFDCSVTSDIPIKSGLSSSAALLVAWIQTLSKVSGINLSSREVGLYAYEAEHDVMKIPCGMMDQLSSAIGKIIHIECSFPPRITPVDSDLKGLVIANTKIRKSTSDVHNKRVKEAKSALIHLKEMVEYDLKTTSYSKVEPFIKQLDDIERDRLIAIFKNRDITKKGLKVLKSRPLNYEVLGQLLNEHQKYLRDYFEVSVEKIDRIIESCIKNGALGGKLTGAGLGGSVIILAPGKEDKVLESIKNEDAVPYQGIIDEGVR
ncbi:MAG: galactokinase [Promethearchaeota archaeon]